MTGSAIIDLPTLFIGILALIVLWDVARTAIILLLQLVSFALMWRYHTKAVSAKKASQCEPVASPSPSSSSPHSA